MSNKEAVTRSQTQQMKRHERELEVGAGGAIAGAAIGALAGPPGVVAGAIVGAVAGAITGAATADGAASAAEEDHELDREIGVEGGEIGAPNLKHPPAKVGAYSAASAGTAGLVGDTEPAEGPMQTPE